MFSESIAHLLIDRLGLGFYFGFSALLLLGPLAVIPWAAIAGLASSRRGRWFGLKIGFCIGFWASLCEVCISYLGMYPNIPGALLGLAIGLGPGAEGTWAGRLCIHGFNLIVWPSFIWFLFRFSGHQGAQYVQTVEGHL
jgi:hypothetical protein